MFACDNTCNGRKIKENSNVKSGPIKFKLITEWFSTGVSNS